MIWKVYKVSFGKPISQELVADIDILNINYKNKSNLETLYLLSKEGITRSALDEYNAQRQATSRFLLANLLLKDEVVNLLKKQLKVLYPSIKVSNEEIRESLILNVIKRESLEGEDSEKIKRKLLKLNRKNIKKEKKNSIDANVIDPKMVDQ